MKIERIDFVAIPSRDAARSAAFYVDTLGLRRDDHRQGVEFEGDTLDTGVCHMAFFSDPDGNALMLHKRYAPYE
jgi:catechol 2,3-dioxygenase-like lactoylglutathione lyase family enzyme